MIKNGKTSEKSVNMIYQNSTLKEKKNYQFP